MLTTNPRHEIEEEPRDDESVAADRRFRRLAALREISGAYTGMYEPGYLERLRAEWPE